MGLTNQRQTHPDIILADIFLRHIPRTGKISKANLLATIYNEHTQEYTSYRDYLEVAFEILHKEKYIEVNISGNGNSSDMECCLTNEGRMLQDAGGYLKRYNERLKKETFDKKVSSAEGSKKIFDNKVKYVLFIIVVLTAVTGVWRSRTSNDEKARNDLQNLAHKDSLIKQVENQSKEETDLTTANEQQSENQPVQTEIDSRTQPASMTPEKKSDNSSPSTSLKPNAPIQVAKADNIEFRLMKATGNTNAQSVTLTLTLTTSAANWYINSHVKSIIDDDGNEYKLSSFTNGASTYLSSIDLVTGVPIKCTYTFGGILSDVKNIKLFKFDYSHSAGQPYAVEFRDIPISWQ